MDVVLDLPNKTEAEVALIAAYVEEAFDQLAIVFEYVEHSADLSKLTYFDVKMPGEQE